MIPDFLGRIECAERDIVHVETTASGEFNGQIIGQNDVDGTRPVGAISHGGSVTVEAKNDCWNYGLNNFINIYLHIQNLGVDQQIRQFRIRTTTDNQVNGRLLHDRRQ